MNESIELNIAKVQQRIRAAEKKYDRLPNSVALMAVSKTRPATAIRQAVAAGISDIGENYLQEALDKQSQLSDLNICWHFIGPIQSNKTRPIAEHFDWVHSVDRLKIAQRLNDQRPAHLPPLNVCLQLNVSNEDSKSGVALEELAALVASVAPLNNLTLKGVMAIPKPEDGTQGSRQAFKTVSRTVTKLQSTIGKLDTLSMGMSGDMEAAIAEGATIVRVGTDIFGKRQ